MIRKSRNQETQPDFDEMMSEVKNEIQEQDAEQDIISRMPELKQLSGDIDKATNTCANARIGLESAIQQYQRAENKLDSVVTTISDKVDTINNHIDKAIEDAPTKLKVTVQVSDADWQKVQDLFALQRQWVTTKMQEHIQEVNNMLVEERKKIRVRYKEYDGCYLGHYAQWFFWFFFTIGFSVVAGGIAILIAQRYGA
ncbi:MAG: hypothetical protein IJ635_09155 [Bacteroidaceae bacterium]|nr:hypothetical protein [Bacteroidaceae bacterium]